MVDAGQAADEFAASLPHQAGDVMNCPYVHVPYNHRVDLQEAAAVFFLTAFAATAQSVTGFGFGLVVIPFLVLVLGPRDAVVLSTMLGTSLSVLMLLQLRSQVPWRPATIAITGAIIGSPVGLVVLVSLNKDVLQVAIAIAVLVATALLIRGYRVPAGGDTGPLIAGFIGGVTRMTAGLPGPPVVLYFKASGLTPELQRAAVTAFFVVTGIAGAALFAGQGSLDRHLAALALVGVPAIVVGWLTGGKLFTRIEPGLFSAIVYVMLVGSSMLAIATALT